LKTGNVTQEVKPALKDVSREQRKIEAGKPLYIARYE
jgi:hypothetical protein